MHACSLRAHGGQASNERGRRRSKPRRYAGSVIVVPAHVAGAFVPLEVVRLTLAGILYWHRAMVLAWDGRAVPIWRQICFGSGLAVIVISLFGPIGHISGDLLEERLLAGDREPGRA